MGVILAPANGPGAMVSLANAGAGEVYAGFEDQDWRDRFGEASDLNRLSGFGAQANAFTFARLLDEISTVRAREQAADAEPLRIWCTFNSAHYTSAQLSWIEAAYLPALANAGLDGVIVSSPRLAASAARQGLSAVASTMCAVYNEDIARVWLDAGAHRVIIPRDVSLEDAALLMAAVPELEYETFLMRNGCIFADSHCLGLHKAGRPSLCRTLRSAPWWEMPLSCDEDWLERRVENGMLYKQSFHENTCGLCALWRFERMGVSAYKVVGRCDDLEALCRDVSLAASNAAVARACESEREYLERMSRPEGILDLCANEGLSCYYPEPRFGL